MKNQLNKQQLANLIWKTADELRGNIDAVKYKDYIFGIMFYKFLSEKEIDYFKSHGFNQEDLLELTDDNEDARSLAQSNIGYYITGDHLFSKWYEDGNDFAIDELTRALSSFDRNITTKSGQENITKLYKGIFDAFSNNLNTLGGSDAEKSKKIRSIVEIIEKIPMHNKDYDVLGFVYEFLLRNFASNAGKKAGEFYSPLSIAEINSQIIANRLKNKNEITLLDMCVGSGSLMLKVGEATTKFLKNKNGVKYYGQEKITETYNLSRMNLIMKGILPDNILIRNGDTLKDDWPYFAKDADDGTYYMLPVDAVSSNPPYSLTYDPKKLEGDPRFEYGMAPKSKADYAFLQHGLYHLKDDGIMCIVLPHGVLFRGGSEGEIRKNLIEHNRIEAIIGLPAGIFNNTGIPTIIAVISKTNLFNGDILFVDASKGFTKEGKINVLRDKDVKKIVDTVNERLEIEKYSKIVSKEEIHANDYNLNIPRYVDSWEEPEKQNIYALMFGGIPADEINDLHGYWDILPNLKDELFTNEEYSSLKCENLRTFINNHNDVVNFKNLFNESFNDFESYLYDLLIRNMDEIDTANFIDSISNNIFNRFNEIHLLDKYDAFQILANKKTEITIDIETILKEGFDSLKQVDPVYTEKNVEGSDTKKESVQTGWEGHVIPFDLIQKEFLTDEFKDFNDLKVKLDEISSSIIELIESMSEEDKDTGILNDAKDSFVTKQISEKLKLVLEDINTPETTILCEYLELSKRADKLNFISNHAEINWESMSPAKDGTYGKSAVNSYINELKSVIEFDEDSIENVLASASRLLGSEKTLKADIKIKEKELVLNTKNRYSQLSKEEIELLLTKKWISPIINEIYTLPEIKINTLISKVEQLASKYATTLLDIEKDIHDSETELTSMLENLVSTGEFDMIGIKEFKKLLGNK